MLPHYDSRRFKTKEETRKAARVKIDPRRELPFLGSGGDLPNRDSFFRNARPGSLTYRPSGLGLVGKVARLRVIHPRPLYHPAASLPIDFLERARTHGLICGL